MLAAFKRDISNWSLFSRTLGIDLYYVLQPFSNRIDRKLSSEEKALFEELDNHPGNNWKILTDAMGPDKYQWFLKEAQDACRDNEIRFFDMNEAMSAKKLDGSWLFVDRAHLTDEGYRVVSDILKDEVLNK